VDLRMHYSPPPLITKFQDKLGLALGPKENPHSGLAALATNRAPRRCNRQV